MTTTLIHHGYNLLKIDARTACETDRFSGGIVTQCWAWDGGDAACLVYGTLPNVSCWTIVRLGDQVRVIEAKGLKMALKECGVDASDWPIVSGPQYEWDQKNRKAS